jgi:hypothetical protein
MGNILRTVLVQNRTEAADRSFQEDLPVNPLSLIIITIRALNNVVDVTRPIVDLLNMITDVGVMFRGADIIRGPLRDLAVLNGAVLGIAPHMQLGQDADDEVIAISVPISLGRKRLWEMECFPATKRGDLILEMTVDVAVNNFDGLVLQIETVELLDANPTKYLKYVRQTTEFGSTGEERVALPIGNPLVGILLTGDTVPTAAAVTATWNQLRLKADNVETRYSRANWDSLNGELNSRHPGWNNNIRDHAHRYNGAAAGFASTLEAIRVNEYGQDYALLDFWPGDQDTFLFETKGFGDVEIQRDSGTQDTGFFYPLELITVATR